LIITPTDNACKGEPNQPPKPVAAKLMAAKLMAAKPMAAKPMAAITGISGDTGETVAIIAIDLDIRLNIILVIDVVVVIDVDILVHGLRVVVTIAPAIAEPWNSQYH
jgi:hypothetical protein